MFLNIVKHFRRKILIYIFKRDIFVIISIVFKLDFARFSRFKKLNKYFLFKKKLKILIIPVRKFVQV